MRKPHFLSAMHSTAMPRELIVFDTETVEHRIDEATVEHRLEFGWALYSRINDNGNWSEPFWYRFTEPQQLWYFVIEQARDKNQLYTFCHNANFDWQVTSMCQIMPIEGWACEKAIIEDPPNCFVWLQGQKKITCLDSTNFWPQSLKKIGERIGLVKFDMPPDWHDIAIADEYCRRDCEIVYRALLDWFVWLRTNDLGRFTISKAGQAMTAYRHRFMHTKIHIHDNEKALKLERESYMGGRTEAWTVGREVRDLIGVDVNSMYPKVMHANVFPTKLLGVYSAPTKQEFNDWLTRYSVVARAWIQCDKPIYPLRSRHGILFPVGTFKTTLTTPELICAVVRGHLRGITLSAVYENAPIFESFIDELYNLRLEFARRGDETAQYNTKVMINSLYGKFGQRGGHDEIIGTTTDLSLRVEDEIDIDTGKRYRIRYIAGVILSRSLDEESRDSFPAIAAHVTAFARQYLWQLIERAGLENVHYMDTDSLHVNASYLSAFDGLIDDERLGALKIDKRIASALYYGPKDYTLDAVATIKGIRAKAVEIEPALFAQEQWVSLRGSLAASHTGGPLVRQVTKRLKRQYKKGTVLSSGRVEPFRLDWEP